jgi:hypothetical protein
MKCFTLRFVFKDFLFVVFARKDPTYTMKSQGLKDNTHIRNIKYRSKHAKFQNYCFYRSSFNRWCEYTDRNFHQGNRAVSKHCPLLRTSLFYRTRTMKFEWPCGVSHEIWFQHPSAKIKKLNTMASFLLTLDVIILTQLSFDVKGLSMRQNCTKKNALRMKAACSGKALMSKWNCGWWFKSKTTEAKSDVFIQYFVHHTLRTNVCVCVCSSMFKQTMHELY